MRKIPDMISELVSENKAWRKICRVVDFSVVGVLIWNIVFLTVTVGWGFFIWHLCAGYTSVWPKLAWTTGTYVVVFGLTKLRENVAYPVRYVG